MIGSIVVYYTVGLGMVLYVGGRELYSMGKETFDNWVKSDSTKADIEMVKLVPLGMVGALANIKVAIRDDFGTWDTCDDLDDYVIR